MTRPDRRLVLSLIAGAVAGGGVAVGAALIGFEVSVAAWGLLGVVVALAWWALTNLLPDPPDGPREPTATTRRAAGAVDLQTRRIEARVRGAVGVTTTASALHETIAELARLRAGDGPYPPTLAAYLSAEPRALSRTRLRAILRELIRL